jgi:hypothetical protein
MPTALCWIYEIHVHPEADFARQHKYCPSIKMNQNDASDSRVFTPLEGLAPIQKTDSAAANMQHMAIVRDFRIP